MKKILLTSLSIVSLVAASQAQVVFLEDFDGVPGPTAGGPGTYNFPAGWTLANVDNGTPATAVAYVNAAWERREDFAGSVTDSAAFSTSWYTPAGTSNDWMITPAIGPLPANTILSWEGKAYDPAFADGYEVRIMTVAPTGGTGVIGNLITASTVLFTTTAEASAWTPHSVSLAAYTGQTVYVSFRNNAADKFILLIDDVKLEAAVANSAELTSLDTVPEYTIIPKSQVYNMPTMATVTNLGTNALTNVALKLNVYDGALTQIYTNTGTPVASVAPAATVQVSAGSYMLPTTPDFYIFEYVVTHSTADSNPSNDTLYNSILVSDSTYARDNGTVVGGLGIGAGNGGYLGQEFSINTTAALTSATYYVTTGYTGRPTACVIWDMVGGVPNAIIASTDTIMYPDDSARVYTLPIHGGPLTLTPGMYTITAVEFVADSTVQIGTTDDIFTSGTTWVDWPTIASGTWTNPEILGASFAKTFVLRLNLNPDCSSFMVTASSSTPATCGSCGDGAAMATNTGGTGPFTYMWSPGGATTASITGVTTGTYTVTMTDAAGCVKMDTVLVGNNCTSFTANADSTDATCGTCPDGTASVNLAGGTGTITFSWAPTGGTAATATGLTPGTYTVTLSDASGCTTTATTTVNFSTSIEEAAVMANTTIYPNPGKDAFVVHIPEAFGAATQIIVTNYLGETVFTKAVSTFGNNEINLSELASGKYTVRFTSEKYTVNKNLTIIK